MVDYTEIAAHEVASPIATITLNRPDTRNAYTTAMSHELAEAFASSDTEENVRVAVFISNGKDFCVGAGSTIILPADYRLTTRDIRFGFVFVRSGIYPEGAPTWFLHRLVGLGIAMDWMIRCRAFDVDEALPSGLVHNVYEPGQILDDAYELAANLAATTAPVSAAITRQLLCRMSNEDSPDAVYKPYAKLLMNAANTPAAAEGVLSFLERRNPGFGMQIEADLLSYLPWRNT